MNLLLLAFINIINIKNEYGRFKVFVTPLCMLIPQRDCSGQFDPAEKMEAKRGQVSNLNHFFLCRCRFADEVFPTPSDHSSHQSSCVNWCISLQYVHHLDGHFPGWNILKLYKRGASSVRSWERHSWCRIYNGGSTYQGPLPLQPHWWRSRGGLQLVHHYLK